MPSIRPGPPTAQPGVDLITEAELDLALLEAVPVYNVKLYGAIGDGSTDDTTAVQSAFDAVPASGGVVMFPPGTFLVSASLLVKSHTTVRGAGMGVSTIKTAAGSYTGRAKASILLNTNWGSHDSTTTPVDVDIHVRDITLDGNRANVTAAATEQEGIDWVNVKWFTIVRVELVNVFHDAIDLDACTNGLIEGCWIVNAGWNGVHAGWSVSYGNTAIHVIGNYVEGCAQNRKTFGDGFNAGIHNDSAAGTIVANQVLGCWQGILVSSTSGSGTTVADNFVNQDETDWSINVSGSNCRVVGNHAAPKSAAYGCINIGGTGTGVVEGNTLGHATQGIKVTATKPWAFIGNRVRGNPIQYGIEMQGAAHVAQGNWVEGKPSNAARGAIHAGANSTGSRIVGNVIDGTQAGRAILTTTADCLVDGNYINGASASYIEVQSANTVVANNRGSAASSYGLILGGASSNACVVGNNFQGCAAAASVAGSGHVYAGNTPTIP